MSVIQKYKDAGTLNIYYDFRSGTVDDFSGNGNDGIINGSLQLKKDGLRFDGNNSNYISVPLAAWPTSNNATFFWIIRYDDNLNNNFNRAWGTDDTGGGGYECRMFRDDAIIAYSDGSTITSIGDIGAGYLKNYKDYFLAVIIDYDGSSDTEQRWYVNGVLKDSDTASSTTLNTPDNSWDIGLWGSDSLKGNIVAYVVIDDTLTQSELIKLYAELSNIKWNTKPKSKTLPTSLINLNDSGIVGAWDMEIQGTTVADLTSNKNGTVNGLLTSFERGIIPDNSTGYVNIGDTTKTIKGVAVSFYNPTEKDKSTTAETLIGFKDGNDYAISFGSVAGTLTDEILTVLSSGDGRDGWTSSSESLSIGWHRLVISFNETDWDIYLDNKKIDNSTVGTPASILADDVILFAGKDSGTVGRFSDCHIEQVEFFDEAKDSNWVTADYNDFAQKVQYKTDWGTKVSDGNVTSGQLEDTDWKVESGTWKVSTDSINNDKVKVFECISAGIVYIPIDSFTTQNNAGYGTWNFWLNKNTSSDTHVLFMSDTIGTSDTAGQDGYELFSDSNEDLRLREINNASETNLFTTNNGAITAGTWVDIKVTRRYDGQFSVYTNENLVGDLASGTNPVTDNTNKIANYICLDFDTGDKIAIADKNGGHSIVKHAGVI